MRDNLHSTRAQPPAASAAVRLANRLRRQPRLSLVYLAVVGALPGAAHAQMTLDFSTGWTSVGANVTYQTTPFTTTSKNTPFTLTAPTGQGMYRLTPVSSTVNGASAADAALGLTTGTVDALLNHNPNFSGSVTNFSVLTQTMTLNAGTYSFAWALNVTDPGFNDGALFSLSGNGMQYLESLARAGGPGDTSGPSPNTYVAYVYDPANGVTPWLTTTFNIATTGTYKVSFADYNWGDLAVPPNFFLASTIGTYTGNPLAGTSAPPATPDITTGFSGSDLVNGTVNPVFDGGTLQADVNNGVYGANLAIKGTGGTIDQNGLNSTFSGVLSDQTTGTPGAMSFVNAGASGGSITLTGVNTYTGHTTVGSGATLALAGAGSIATSSRLVNDGVFDIAGTSGGASLISLAGAGTVQLGAHVLTLTNAADTFAGSINGSGGLTVAGGTQTLSGVNGFTGETSVVSGATLVLSGAGNIAASSGLVNNGILNIAATTAGATLSGLSGDGSVLLGAQTLTLANTGSSSFGGAISGSGGLAVVGGTQTLTRANGFLGATTVASGATLILTGAGAIAASSGLTNDGTFDIGGTTSSATLGSLSGSGTVVLGARTLTLADAGGNYAGTIGGTGGLVVTGGTQTLSGVNGFTGATSLAGGATLALSGAGSIAASDGLANDGTLDISGTSAGARLKTITGTGNVVLGSRTLTVDTMADAFRGAISGSGGVQLNGGRWTVDNAQAYTGLTSLAAATLHVNGSLAGGVNVGSGAVLQGSGAIAGPVTVAAGGKLSPGNSPGVMTVGASVTLAAGSSFEVDINGATPGNGAGHHDQLVLTGAGSKFSAGGAQLTVNLVGISGLGTYTPYAPTLGQRFRIVTAEGGLDATTFGAFSQPTGLAAGTRLRTLYLVDGVELLVVPSAYLGYARGQGANLNTQSVAAALDAMVAAQGNASATAPQTTLEGTVAGLDSARLVGTMRALSGELHGAIAAALPSAGQRLQDAASRHVAALETRQRGLWIDYSGGTTRWTSDAVSSAARATSRSQVTVGFDILNDGRNGVGVAVSQSNQKLRSDSGGNGEVKDTLGMVYGQLGLGDVVTLDGRIGGGGGKATSSRDDPLATLGLSQGQLTTDASTRQVFAGVGMRAALNFETIRVQPYARVETQRIRRDAVVEDSGSIAALSLGRLSASGGRVEVGVDLGAADKDPGKSRFTFGGRLAVGRDTGSLQRGSVDASLAGTAIEIQAPRASRQYLRAELTGTWLVMPGGYVYAGVNGLSRERRTDSSVSVGAVVAF